MTQNKSEKQRMRARNMIVFASIALVWFLMDYFTKRHFNNGFERGELLSEPMLGGLFHFRLIHNSGAAWGIFDDSTMILGIVSLVVCILLMVYLLVIAPRANIVEAIGLGLVFSGGLGNALDRFFVGYVVDFIEVRFIDFPVFNIADIGVTCGFVIFLIGFIVNMAHADKHEKMACDDIASNEDESK